MDQVDQQISALLKSDSKLTHREIGEKVHLTGQAVGQRITHLVANGTIQNYTVNIDYGYKQFIRLSMTSLSFSEIERAIKEVEQIDEFYKVSGPSCYFIVSHFNPVELTEFIELVSKWAIYSVDTVVGNRLI
ncbi:Lrp/AsnC family transcriptional regulator [Carnobacterium gallinarum]|uniref:Lrp/AsnC family transcriptional regulator n=1 Tax=Carnobacterium gallinarum TaxID=2749 RepID=UPI00054D2728|nr:AsnC family transcriptional regulator [Carnobacterium gallinarum]